MAYNPLTDFLALWRRNSNGTVAGTEMPGLDFVVAAMARAGMFRTYVGQYAPTVNQPTTVWIKPALPSWTGEAVVFLWNVNTGAYEAATPALWAALLNPADGVAFQFTAIAVTVISNDTTLFAIERANPGSTVLVLPSVQDRAGKALRVVDWSSAVAAHQITLTPAIDETIMKLGTFKLFSTADQLAGVTLYPSTDLDGWVITP